MSGGPKRNADKINTIGIVMIGICGAVLVYVSIAALQAFYANDVADVQTMADYGGQDISAKDLKAAQIGNITNVGKTGKGLTGDQLYQIKIEDGMAAVLKSANGDKQTGVVGDPTNLVPSVGAQTTPTIQPLYGRPKALPTPGAGSGSATGTTPPPATDGSAGAGSGSGSGSATQGAADANPGAANGGTGLGGTTGTAPQSPTGTTTNTPIKGAGDKKGADKTEKNAEHPDGKTGDAKKGDAKKGATH